MNNLSVDKAKAVALFDDFMSSPDINEMAIIGPPGTGKTWFIAYLVNYLKKQQTIQNHLLNEKNEVSIFLTAPTNESARTLSEEAKHEATTLHTFLGLSLKDDYRTGKQRIKKTRDYFIRANSLIVVDEAGWLSETMVGWLRRTVRDCKILYVGDPKQLVDVHSSSSFVFDTVPYQAHLKINFRNNNPIGEFAKHYRSSVDTEKFPVLEKILEPNDHIKRIDGEEFQKLIEQEFLGDNFQKKNHSKIVAWRNNTVKAYNDHIRSLFTDFIEFQPNEIVTAAKPVMHNGMFIYPTDFQFRIKDVIDSVNIQGVQCYIAVSEDGAKLTIPYDQSEVTNLIKQVAEQCNSVGSFYEYFRTKELFDDIRPVYAGTTHKAQGKTYSSTFIDLDDIGDCFEPHVVQRLLTVATSRPKNMLYLFGDLPKRYGGNLS